MVANLFLVGVLFFLHFQDVTPGFLKERSVYERAALVEDFDGDGDQDVLLYSLLPGETRLLENIGDQSFFDVTEAWGFDLTLGFREILAGDFNNDGFLDLLLIVNLPDSPMRLLMNTGRRYFVELRDRALNTSVSQDICLGDWNNDGYLDLITLTHDTPPEIKILENREGERFVFSHTAFPDMPEDSITYFSQDDLDGDGLIDLLIATDRSLFAVLNGDIPQIYTISEETGPVNIVSERKTAGDLIGIIHSLASEGVYLLRRGIMKLEPINADELERFPLKGVISDIDLDGRPEIVGIDKKGFPVIYTLGEDRGLHPLPLPCDRFTKTLYSVSVGDFDGNRAGDLVLVGIESVHFLLNQNPVGHYIEIKTLGSVRHGLVSTLFCQGEEYSFSLAQKNNLHGIGEAEWIDSLIVSSDDREVFSFYNIPADTSITLPSLQIEESGVGAFPLDTSIVRVTPNPSSRTFTFSLSLDEKSELELQVISTSGAVVEDVASGIFEPGEYSFTWDASDYVPGIYLLRVAIERKSFLKKLILLK